NGMGINIGEVIGCNPRQPEFAVAERSAQSGGKQCLKQRKNARISGNHHAGSKIYDALSSLGCGSSGRLPLNTNIGYESIARIGGFTKNFCPSIIAVITNR